MLFATERKYSLDWFTLRTLNIRTKKGFTDERRDDASDAENKIIELQLGTALILPDHLEPYVVPCDNHSNK